MADIRQKIPQLPSGLVQTARDQASDMLKREKCMAHPTKKRLQVRYDRRTFKFYPENGYVSLSTALGRLIFKTTIYEYIKQYLQGKYTNAQLIIRKGRAFLNIQCELPDIPVNTGNRVLGVDRGILNIVTCDDNTFANSRHFRAVKGRYQYLKAKLQSLGTPSAQCKLVRLSGRERRFTLDTNHVIAKQIVEKPYDVLALEALSISKRKVQGRKFNRKLGGWSYGQLLSLLKYKAENLGKIVVEVNPRHTSQRCSKCGYIDRNNRHGLGFHCRQCGFQLDADLNAARNIAPLGKSELSRPDVNEPIVTHTAVTSPRLQPWVVD
ncbi:MAG: transposase [Nitrososphaeria archaeon]